MVPCLHSSFSLGGGTEIASSISPRRLGAGSTPADLGMLHTGRPSSDIWYIVHRRNGLKAGSPAQAVKAVRFRVIDKGWIPSCIAGVWQMSVVATEGQTSLNQSAILRT